MLQPNQLKTTALKGLVKEEVFPFLLTKWSPNRGERVIAEIGNEKQIWKHETEIKRKTITIEKRGWREIMASTCLGRYNTQDGLEVWAVIIDGGRNAVNKMEGVKIVAAIYKGDESITGRDPLIIEDKLEITKVDGKRNINVIQSAFDILLKQLHNLKLKKKETVEISISTSEDRLENKKSA